VRRGELRSSLSSTGPQDCRIEVQVIKTLIASYFDIVKVLTPPSNW
jgi:hypothetical protein